jgi:hypothetical protein
MPHRIETREEGNALRLEFHGDVDRGAIAEISAIAQDAHRKGRAVVVVLAAGTEVDAECTEPLCRIEGVTVKTVSPFLARWLRCGC